MYTLLAIIASLAYDFEFLRMPLLSKDFQDRSSIMIMMAKDCKRHHSLVRHYLKQHDEEHGEVSPVMALRP
jgi:hypothetical protein